jgi:hypothetical protein
MRAFLVLIAIVLASHAAAWTHGYTPCVQGAGLGDGCPNPLAGSYQQPNFFTGYANQSYGLVLPGITVKQPAAYTVRPPWNVAGVDYAVGLPRSYLPVSSLKDPATIGTDALANPDGANADCQFFATSTLASNLGPAVVCTNNAPGAVGPIIQGYRWYGTYGTQTAPDCVGLVIKDNAWASITIQDNLFLNGPNCNYYHGAESAGSAFQIDMVNGSTAYPRVFSHNTDYGCGADNVSTSSQEYQLCSQTFAASLGYNGTAPVDNHFMEDYPDGNETVQYNAFIHQPGRGLQQNCNGNGSTNTIQYNYVEGLVYQTGSQGLQEHGEFKEYGTACAGSVIVNTEFNTFLQTSYVNSGEANFYLSGGGVGSGGGVTFTGDESNNVFVVNVNPNVAPYRTYSIAGVSFSYNNFGVVTVNNNWLDPTGAAYCFATISNPTGTGNVSFSGNKSLLGPSGDASTNGFNNSSPCYGHN